MSERTYVNVSGKPYVRRTLTRHTLHEALRFGWQVDGVATRCTMTEHGALAQVVHMTNGHVLHEVPMPCSKHNNTPEARGVCLRDVEKMAAAWAVHFIMPKHVTSIVARMRQVKWAACSISEHVARPGCVGGTFEGASCSP